MTAAERLQAAIDKLEKMRSRGSDGLWAVDEITRVQGKVAISNDVGRYVAHYVDSFDAETITTLHRTLEAQVTILRAARDDIKLYGGKPVSYLAASFLADAILGATS